jgi:hypothetical protein
MKILLEISVSYRSGLVKWSFMQAYIQVSFNFLIETTTAKMGNIPNYSA